MRGRRRSSRPLASTARRQPACCYFATATRATWNSLRGELMARLAKIVEPVGSHLRLPGLRSQRGFAEQEAGCTMRRPRRHMNGRHASQEVIAPDKIVICGESLGGGVGCGLGEQAPASSAGADSHVHVDSRRGKDCRIIGAGDHGQSVRQLEEDRGVSSSADLFGAGGPRTASCCRLRRANGCTIRCK